MPRAKSKAKSKTTSKARSRAKSVAKAARKRATSAPARVIVPTRSALRFPSLPGRLQQALLFALAAVTLVGGGVAVAATLPVSTEITITDSPVARSAVTDEYDRLTRRIAQLEDAQSAVDAQVVSSATLQRFLTPIQLEIEGGQYAAADGLIRALGKDVSGWVSKLPAPKRVVATPPADLANSFFIPILLYHYTPVDFETQLEVLEQRGYSSITLEQVATALAGTTTLPAKPVVITFDDGFANQMQAFDLLKKHNFKATFFIINGGPESQWCIGASRRFNDPLQPPQGCGDAYLTWDQIRVLDQSGLITIGGHTLNHRDLASLTPADQRHEIIDSKSGIEQELGHPIYDFAYPYGSYNDTTIQIVQAAGYADAVTTLPGSYQSASELYTLRRLRDAYSLP